MFLNARITIACLLVLGIARAAAADLPEVVRRHVDDSTIAVGRIDLSGLDSKALLDFATGLMADVPAAQRDRSLAELRDTLDQFDQATGPLRASGVTKAWFLVHGDSLMRREPPLVIVPVENDQQAKIVTDFLTERAREHQVVEGAVLIGSKSSIAAAQAIRPAERPNFAEGFDEEGAALHVVVEPTPAVRMASERAMEILGQRSPQVPAESIGLVTALKLVQLTVSLPPQPHARLAFDFADAAAAEQAQGLLSQGLAAARQAAESAGAGGAEMTPEMRQQIADALAPAVEDTSVVIALEEHELQDTLAKALSVAAVAALQRARQVRAGSNLRMIGMAMRQIAIDDVRHGSYPPDIQTLVLKSDLPVEVFISPRSRTQPPQVIAQAREVQAQWVAQNSDCVYLGGGLTDSAPASLMVAFEDPEKTGQDDGVNVLYADASVRFLPLPAFREEIERHKQFRRERGLAIPEAIEE